MKFSCPIEIKDGAERFRMAIEKVFVVYKRVVVAKFDDGLVSVAVSKSTKTGVRESVERSPKDFVFYAPNVDDDSAVERLRAHYHEGLGRQ